MTSTPTDTPAIGDEVTVRTHDFGDVPGTVAEVIEHDPPEHTAPPENLSPAPDLESRPPLMGDELAESDDPLDFDDLVNELTLEDLEELEKIFEIPIGKFLGEINTDELSALTLKAVVWISLRKTDPDITLEQAGKVKLRRLAEESAEVEPGSAPSPQ